VAPFDRIRWTRARKDRALALVLALAIAAGWLLAGGFFAGHRFSDPISYRGDSDFTAAVVAAARRGEWSPFGSKLIPSLGAPFVASWNDFPGTDDVIFWLVGLLARVTDTIVAINLGFLVACVTSGLSMFFVARRFGFRREGALLSGFLFGLAPYLFMRNVHHYSLTFIGVLPFNVLVMAYLGSRRGVPFGSARFRLAAVISVLTGWSFTYYAFFAAQLYTLGAVAGLMRHGRRVTWKPVLALAAILAAAVLSVSLDTLLYRRAHGPNPAAVQRQPSEVELYALKPVNFFLGSRLHPILGMRNLSDRGRAQSIIQGEEPGPYLGLVGGALLLGLAVAAMASIARRQRPTFVLAFAATAAWFIIAHAVGGLNSVMGLFGVVLLRSVNRASVVVLTLVLLFGAWAIPWLLRAWSPRLRWALTLALGVPGLVDVLGLDNPLDSLPAMRAQADSDRALVATLEANLPAGAMVFQLPAMHFPEVGPLYGVDGYELFRPSYFANTLRFSHGDVKGRPDADWKFRVAGLPADQLVKELKAAGFSAILLNRRGYPDGGAALAQGLGAQGCRIITLSRVGESLALMLP